MLKNKKSFLLLFLLSFYNASYGQQKDCKIMFYNVENLFDTVDDSTKNDNEFLPDGKKRWTKERYETKINYLYKTIVAAGEGQQPDIVGLCEIENNNCLKEICLYSPLLAYEYRFVHYESPDPRGIDVALLYNSKTFKVLQSKPIAVELSGKRKTHTRDILMVKGIILPNDTVYIYVNHWPSRMMGEERSESKRIQVATILRKQIDTLIAQKPRANIIIMGDFNDTPQNTSITDVLQAGDCNKGAQLCNLSLQYTFPGTYKYKGNWDVFDQIIVSQSLINLFRIVKADVVHPDFLLMNDDTYTGQMPFRTFNGVRYLCGFSDHLPVMLNLTK